MSSIQPRGRKFQLRVVHKLLPQPFFFTFDTREQARTYGDQLELLLSKGVVPSEMLEPTAPNSPRVVDVIDLYEGSAPVAPSDKPLLKIVAGEVVGLRVSGLTFQWVESYVRKLKTVQNLAPGSIRKRVESLARVLDWHLLRTVHTNAGNPLRMLPRGYSGYSDQDKALLIGGSMVKLDVQRDRRLSASEIDRVRAALAGGRVQGRERALKVDPAFSLLFELILDTGMRLKEAYRLRVDQVDFTRKILRVEGTKGHRGVLKPRNVPLRMALLGRMREWCAGREGLVFPFWDGDKREENKTTNRLSARFAALFDFAGVLDATEHDLRHTACCQWIELRRPDGQWVFSETEVCKIMGWSDTKMLLRYASLRGEDLSDKLDGW